MYFTLVGTGGGEVGGGARLGGARYTTWRKGATLNLRREILSSVPHDSANALLMLRC